MLARLLIYALIAYIIWRLWQAAQQRAKPPPPTGGFTPDPEQLVRCERCGVRVPASQVAAIRANCRQCGNDPPH